MLDTTERKKLKDLLYARFNMSRLREIVDNAGRDYESVVRQNAQKVDAIMDIVDNAEGGWTLDLLRSTEQIANANFSSPAKEDVIAEIKKIEASVKMRYGRGTALKEPFETCFVRAGSPFVNRPKIRDAFMDLKEPAGARIVVVNGASKSGKTYSKELPQFVAEIQEETRLRIYYRDLSEGDYSFTAEKLVESILRYWNLGSEQIPSHYSAQSSSYGRELSEWLVPKTPKGESWWVIIDGLAKFTPDPKLLQFLTALAEYIAETPFAFRLVLLDFGEKISLPSQISHLTRRITLDPITEDDLIDHYFKLLQNANHSRTRLTKAVLEKKAKWILEHAADKANETPSALRECLLQATAELGFA